MTPAGFTISMSLTVSLTP